MSQNGTSQQAVQAVLQARLAELHGERDRARERLERAEDRIRSVNILIEDHDLLALLMADHPTEPETGSTNGNYATMGLRESIRAALGRASYPLRPRDVTDRLHAGGYHHTSGVKLGVRVSSEMHRMMKVQQLHRTANGRYRVKA